MLEHTDRIVSRDFAVQFLYQCETEKVFYFSSPHWLTFVEHFQVPQQCQQYMRTVCEGVLDKIVEIDALLGAHSLNWKVSRMAVMDRAVLRLAAHEILVGEVPPKVILNEAINLAKKYGTADSSAFVNGILDAITSEFARKKHGSNSPTGEPS